MKTLQTLNNSSFASCETGGQMLITLAEVAGRNLISVPMYELVLIRDEIFRGKYSPRQNQLKQTVLEERTPLAPKS
ncbi:MAG TPA: hypothetical protein VGI03_02665 [Verrucomicrobiae bacterium]|jgi:hypothetical protein